MSACHLERDSDWSCTGTWCGLSMYGGDFTSDIDQCTCLDCLRAVHAYGVEANVRLCAILFPPKPEPPDPGDVEVSSWSAT